MPTKAPAKGPNKRSPQKRRWTQVACPECGREMGKNNLQRHIDAKHSPDHGPMGRAVGPARPLDPEEARSRGEKKARTRAMNRAIDEYMAYLASGGARFAVNLSGIPGFNNGRYTDPDLIDAAIGALRDAAKTEPPSGKRVLLIQRIRNLQEAAERLRRREDADATPEDAFIKFGATYSEENRISYETWRDAGVPARVLKEAGIDRG